MTMSHVRNTYLDTSAAVVKLLGNPAVGEHWDEGSVLAEFKVSGLAGHLARSIFQVVEYLDGSVIGVPPISAAVYFADLEGTADVDSKLNVSVRERGDEAGKSGPMDLPLQAAAQMTVLRERLSTEPPDRLIQVFGWRVMLLDEYLKTRLVEMVVHVEDLALSIGAGVGLPVDAMEIATDTVQATARVRHGDMAVLRAMTRRERDHIEATRVF